MESKLYSVRFSPKTQAALKFQAASLGLSVSDVVRLAVINDLEKLGKISPTLAAEERAKLGRSTRRAAGLAPDREPSLWKIVAETWTSKQIDSLSPGARQCVLAEQNQRRNHENR